MITTLTLAWYDANRCGTYVRPVWPVPEPYQAGQNHMPVHPYTNLANAFDWNPKAYYGWWEK